MLGGLVSTIQERHLEGAAEQRELRTGVRRPQRPQGREGEDEVSEPACPQDRNFLYALYHPPNPYACGGAVWWTTFVVVTSSRSSGP